jgi:hypothetical protein
MQNGNRKRQPQAAIETATISGKMKREREAGSRKRGAGKNNSSWFYRFARAIEPATRSGKKSNSFWFYRFARNRKSQKK